MAQDGGMRLCLLAIAPTCAAALAAAAPLRADDSVTIYRCTDARGKVELRDSPCPDGRRQTSREMVRPVDAPRPVRPEPAVAPAPQPPAAPSAPQVVVIQPPRPMYECTTPDGKTYTSESPEGNPRWVPLWTLDYPVLAERHVYRPGGASIRYHDGRIDGRLQSGGVRREVVPTLAGYGAGTWIRDACSALPQAEVCERLRDRRDEVRRLAFNGQPSERARLDVEERGINARLSTDCGGR